MKTLMNIAFAMVVVLAFGNAYADDNLTGARRDVGSDLYDNAFKVDHVVMSDREFAAIPGAIIAGTEGLTEAKIEVGSALYDSAFAKDDIMLGSTEAKGSAAGGMAVIDEKTKIWDNTLAVPGGGSDQL